MDIKTLPWHFFTHFLVILVAYPPYAAAFPNPRNSSSVLNQVFNNGTVPTSNPFGRGENPPATIAFGVFSIVIAFGSLVVGIMQYRRCRQGQSLEESEEQDLEMQSIPQRARESRRSSQGLPHTTIPPPQVHTFTSVSSLPNSCLSGS